MRTFRAAPLVIAAVVGMLGLTSATAQAQAPDTNFDRLANLPFPGGAPTAESAKTLKDEMLFQRACQIYEWAMPLEMTLGMQVGSEKAFGAGYNVLPIWKRLTDAKTRVITPNTVTMYAVSYLDLGKDGPLVMDAPPRLQGFISDYWGRPLPVDGGKFAGDIGFPGPDGGKGGKFLFVPPGYKNKIPDGYYVYRSEMNNVMLTLRGFVAGPKDLEPTAKHLELTKIYPLNGEANAKPMQFPDASVAVDMLPLTDASAFEQLKLLLDNEGENVISPDMRGMLASIGIVKGQPFNPDSQTRAILERAAKTGYKTARVLANESVINGISQVMWANRHWLNPFAEGTASHPSGPFDMAFVSIAGQYPELDLRTAFFSYSWGASPGMLTYTPGQGAIYAVGSSDSEGGHLIGDNNYRLNLPANVPAKLFWSVTLYDAFTGSLYDNGNPFPALGSPQKPVQNADGSTDLYFGPKAPEGKADNWLATTPGKGYFVVLRLYGPMEAAIDKSWKPGDFEKVK